MADDDVMGKCEENVNDNGHWRSAETRGRSLENLRPFSGTHRPVHPGRPKDSGLKRELLKALRTRLKSDPLGRRMVTLIAQAMVKAAAKGNVQAAQFIRDEIDGRLPKPMEGEVPPSQIFVQVATNVERHPHYDWSRLSPEMQALLPESMRPKPQGT